MVGMEPTTEQTDRLTRAVRKGADTMFESFMQKATGLGRKLIHTVTNAVKTTGGKIAALFIAGAGVETVSQLTAHATSGGTTPSTAAVQYSTFYSMFDVLNSILNILYPVVVPILIAGSAVFVAWWAWHRLKGAVS